MYTVKYLLLIAAACAASLVGAQGAAAGSPGDVVCSGAFPVSFSGTARNLIVKDAEAGHGNCVVDGATITHDVIVEQDGFVLLSNTTIGHDIVATEPQVVGTGTAPDDGEGPVTVGHDVVINGSRRISSATTRAARGSTTRRLAMISGSRTCSSISKSVHTTTRSATTSS
jgi:hypothetical protein